MVFPVNIGKILRIAFVIEQLWELSTRLYHILNNKWARCVLIMCYVVSACFYHNKFATTNKQDIKEIFVLKNVYFICCSIYNFSTLNNRIKFTTRSNKVKVHRTDLQPISLYPIGWMYPVGFFTDILFSSLVSFAFCLLVWFAFYLN